MANNLELSEEFTEWRDGSATIVLGNGTSVFIASDGSVIEVAIPAGASGGRRRITGAAAEQWVIDYWSH